jgi:hypothetical protein
MALFSVLVWTKLNESRTATNDFGQFSVDEKITFSEHMQKRHYFCCNINSTK